MNWKLILLLGLSLILMGCVTTRPTKPTLEVKAQPDGGICLDRANAAKLGAYILELENR
jgi:hypothetical protein